MKANLEELTTMLHDFRANGISHEVNNGLDAVLRFQDIIGHSNPGELGEVYRELESNDLRKTFLWASVSCCGPETAEDVIRYTTVRLLREQEIDNLNGEYEKLFARERVFEESKKAIHKRLARQKKEIAELERTIRQLEGTKEYFRQQAIESRNNAAEYAEKARKYDGIKNLLA